MSFSSSDSTEHVDDRRPNHPYGWMDEASQRIWADAVRAVEAGDQGAISDDAVARLLTAALKLYYAKTDGEERTFRPVLGRSDETITATEVLTGTSELLRALHLGPVELGLWFRRRPTALASEASGQRGNSNEVRAPDTGPEPGSSARRGQQVT
jgi:hypothetical protein